MINMNCSVYFQIVSLFYIILLAIVYFSKKRLNSIDNKIYKYLIIINILALFLDVFSIYTILNMESMHILNYIVTRLYVALAVAWIIVFSIYIFYISVYENQEEYNKNKSKLRIFSIFSLILYIVFFLVLFLLPMDYNVANGVYSYGMAANLSYIISAIYVVINIVCTIYNFKNIKSKKYIPIFLFIILGITVILIQINFPNLLLITSMDTFITFLMYHTIENPDIKMLTQLNLAKDHAEKANRAKSDFLSSMSHEIRTPLNAIVGFSQMIESEDTIEGCKENAKDIITASQTLLEIVNGILDISKIEANKMEIVNKEYQLLPELNNLAKLMIPRIGEKPIKLKTNFAEDIPSLMYGDVGKIKQIITNILTNAVKYTEEGEINFNVNCINEEENSSLVISVRDTGRGIKKEKIEKLFTKFNRLDEDKNTTIEGTGLGLAITKSLVEMMGGKIVVQSEYKKGSVFTVYLKQKIIKLHQGEEAREYKEKDNYDFTGNKILIVDDNKLNLKVVTKILEKYKIETETAESGMECLEKIEKGKEYDLIFMDDMMPKMTGRETLIRLKRKEGFEIPVIALTANAITGIREQYLHDGFNDYLGKPIEKLELIKILSTYLKEEEKIQDKKILIVDDNKMNIKIATNMMKEYNFEIEEALSGMECLEKVKEKNYEIIFMDYMMPEMDGIETLQKLKEQENFKTPVVALTADAGEGSREKFLNAGFIEYISKPINKNHLNEVIEKIMKENKKEEVKKEYNEIPEELLDMSKPLNEIEIIEPKKYQKNEQFSSVYITKEKKGNIEYLKENNVDVETSIDLLGGIEMYNETIQEFINNATERISKLNDYVQNSDMKNYAIEVHALKSDSKYLGFKKLAEKALEHELKSKENNIEYVKNNYSSLMEEFNKILEIVKEYI